MLPFFFVTSHRRLCAVFLSLTLSLAAIAADSAQRNFNVPAGLAEDTLKRFSEQAGVQVIFPTDRVQGIRTKAVKGEMEPAGALEQMVAGTELVVIRDDKTGALGIRREASVERAEKNDSGVAQKSGDRPNPDDQGTDRQDGVIELSPFEVRADKDVGYESTNANSISGLNTSLLNVPVTAEIYNKQFYDDLAISSVAETLLEWGSGQSPNGKPQTGIQNSGDYVGNTPFVVRGIASGPPRLDGFMNGGLNFLDNTFQERTEVIRGPQSLLYGTSNAGGIVNIVSKQASFTRNNVRLRLRVDGYGSLRGEVDANIALSKKAALRVALTRSDEEFYQDFSTKKVNSWYLAAAYRPFQRATIRVFGGVSKVDKYSGADSNANLPGDPRSGQNINLLLAQGLTDGLYFRPLDWSNVDSVAGSGTVHTYDLPHIGANVDVTLASWLDLRVQGGYDSFKEQPGLSLTNSQGVLSPASTNNPTGKWATGARVRGIDGTFTQRGVRALLNARFDLWRDRIKNNLTVGFDATRQYNWGGNAERFYLLDSSGNFVVDPAKLSNVDAGRTEMPIVYWSLEDTATIFRPEATEYTFSGNTYRRAPQLLPGMVAPTTGNPLGYNSTSLPSDLLTRDRGYYGNLYSEWFNNRVSSMVGVRRNYRYLQRQNRPDPTEPVWATTWSAGAVYHFNDYLSPYYNYSLSYAPNNVNGVSQDGKLPTVNSGKGTEIGLKYAIPRWKLTGALALYRIDAVDRSTTMPSSAVNIIDPSSAINGRHLNQTLIYFPDFSVKGLELSTTANPTPDWRLRLSVSYNSDVAGKRITLDRWYNDEFRTNTAGQVIFSNGAVAMVPSIASNPSSPQIPLTVAMMKDPASGYFASLDTGSGRIRDLGGRTFAALGLVGRVDGLTIGTERTGLPISSHQLGWVPPTSQYILVEGGDRLAIPRSTESVTVTRSFSEGRLKGFTAGLTVVARQHQLAYYYVDKADGNVRKEKILPDQVNTNLMLSYSFKLRSKYKWTTQFNVINLLNHRDLVYIRNVGSGVFENARMNQVPRSWVWTNTVDF